MPSEKIRICYVPGREYAYVRTRVVLAAMREAGFEVFDCSYPRRSFFRHLITLAKFLSYKGKCDIIYVGFLAQFLMPFVKLFTNKKIIFEAFVSTYQTLAFDRKTIHPNGPFARIVRWIEKKGCLWSDAIYLDTNAQIEYFKKEYKLNGLNFKRSWVGCDEQIIFPQNKIRGNEFLVHFHGEFQALHGTQYIIDAAKLLPDVKFQMIGKGRELKAAKNRAQEYGLTNVEFISQIAYEELPKHMANADICLGLFGDTEKTNLVIPFKVYEGLAMAKPVITADTPAIRELLADQINVFLCKTASGEALADAIKKLRADNLLREKIAQSGHDLFKEKCSLAMIGQDIYQTAQEILKN